MKVTGRGDLFLAQRGRRRAPDRPGRHADVFSPSTGPTCSRSTRRCPYDIWVGSRAPPATQAARRLYNCASLDWVGSRSSPTGTPVVLNVDQQTYADPQAAVAWSSGLQTGLTRNDTFNLGTLMGRSTGERYTLSFHGRGFVIVQPSEVLPGGFLGGSGGGEQSGSVGGMFGGLLGR